LLQPWVALSKSEATLKALANESVGERCLRFVNAFSVATLLLKNPGLKQPWAEIGERFQR
jgi:hypothetical protein